MLDIAFLSRIIPKDIKEEVQNKRKNTMSESGESLQWKLIEGFDENNSYPVKLYNFMPVQSWPKSYSDPFIKTSFFSHTNGANDKNLGFMNVMFVKRIFMGRSLYREIKKWAKSNSEGDKVLILYSLTPEFLNAARIVKRINSSIIVCAIVADLPEYTILEKNIKLSSKIYLGWMKNATNSKLNYIDKFSLLTKQMANKLVTFQDYIVVEGISTSFPVECKNEVDDDIVLYAGTLHERFGIKKLVDAFEKYVISKKAKLVVCGLGDSEEYIKNAAVRDRRIEFLGQITREQVLEKMRTASVIVNPRCSDEDYTQYSFPSKNIEALSSGIPFIGYKLAGIPNEYDEYINYPSDDTEAGLGACINTILSNKDIYFNKAKRAKVWINNEKNQTIQTKHILEMIVG